jgi:hypothetical protein
MRKWGGCKPEREGRNKGEVTGKVSQRELQSDMSGGIGSGVEVRGQ